MIPSHFYSGTEFTFRKTVKFVVGAISAQQKADFNPLY